MQLLLCQEIVQNSKKKPTDIKGSRRYGKCGKGTETFPHFPQRNDGDWSVRATTIMRIMPQRACIQPGRAAGHIDSDGRFPADQKIPPAVAVLCRKSAGVEYRQSLFKGRLVRLVFAERIGRNSQG